MKASLLLPHIQSVKAFGHSEYVPPDCGWIKLNANEAYYPPSPKITKAIQEIVSSHMLRLYPSPDSAQLKAALAQIYQVEANQILVGNGSESIFSSLIQGFCKPLSSVAIYKPGYPLYTFLASTHNVQCEYIDLDYTLDLQTHKLSNLHSSLLFLSSPHWPTGVNFSDDAIREVLRHFKGIVVLDEAYAGFSKKTKVSLLKEYTNLIIVKTFSKHYALAGLRVAYAIGSPAIIEYLKNLQGAYKLGALAQAGAIAALQDATYYEQKITCMHTQRDNLEIFFKNLGWHYYPSQGNFILFRPQYKKGNSSQRVALELYQYLKDYKILVRYFDQDLLTQSYLRISIGTKPEMIIVKKAIEAFANLPSGS